MPVLDINGRRVEVDDGFLSLSPEDRAKSVDEIAGQIGNAPQKPIEASGQLETSPGTPPLQEGASAASEAPGALERFENVVGAGTTGVGSGLTLGFKDELMAGLASPFRAGYRAVIGEDEGKSFGERLGTAYDIELQQQRDIDKKMRAKSPVAAFTGELAGGLVTGGGASKAGLTALNVAKPTIPRMVAAGATEGAAYGGIHGFGTGEGAQDRLSRAGAGAAVGALTGGAMGAAGGVGAKIAARSQTAKEIPGVEALEVAKREAYKEVDKLGATYKPEAYNKLLTRLEQSLTKAKLHPTRHPKAASMLEQLRGESGKRMPLSELDQWRQVVRRDVANASDDAERFMGQKMIDVMDDFMANAQVRDMTRRTSAKAASNAILKARSLNTRWRKSEIIEDALIRAQRQANSAGSGGNINNAIRQQFKTILNSKKLSRPFTESERVMMDKIVQGGRLDNFARRIGKLSPEGNGLMLALQGLGALHTGGASIPVMVGAAGAKRFADAATQRGVSELARTVRGGTVPQAPALSQGSRQALSGGTAAAVPQFEKLATPAQAGPQQSQATLDEFSKAPPELQHKLKVQYVEKIMNLINNTPPGRRDALIRQLFSGEHFAFVQGLYGRQAADILKEEVLRNNLRPAG